MLMLYVRLSCFWNFHSWFRCVEHEQARSINEGSSLGNGLVMVSTANHINEFHYGSRVQGELALFV